MAVQVPWDQFCAAGVPDEYAALIAREGGEAVLVSRAPDGTWASASGIDGVWRAVCAATPVESHLWNTMRVESDHYPWEVGRAAPRGATAGGSKTAACGPEPA